MKKLLLCLLLALPAVAQPPRVNATQLRFKAIKNPLTCAANGYVLTWVSANLQFECLAPGAAGSGITTLNTLTTTTQTFATGTTGSDFSIVSATSTHTFNFPSASASNRGLLLSADWTIFNAKESALTFSAPLSRSVNAISCIVATGSVAGCLSAADWTTFNAKQAALGFTPENAANKDAVSGYAGLTASSLLKTAEFPAFTGDVSTVAGGVVTTIGPLKVLNSMIAAATIDLTAKVTGALPTANMATASLIRPCEIAIGDPGAASSALADDNDSPVSCGNKFGATLTITAVECYAATGSPTVTPIITGGAATSILTGALTCGTGSFASGTLNGTPTQSSNGTIDANITTAGGTAKYIVIRITRTL